MLDLVPCKTTISVSRHLLIALPLLTACGHAPAPAPAREAPVPHLRPLDGSAESAPGPVPEPEVSRALPDPAAGPRVSLAGLLLYADKFSPVLSVARSTRSRADAARAAAEPLLPGNPELLMGAGMRKGAAGTGSNILVQLLQPLWIAGERGLRRDAAETFGALTDAEIEQIRWVVHCDVHAAFHRALVERERLRLAERVVAFQEEVLHIVERQIAAGETAPLTLRIAQAETAQARQEAVAARQALRASHIRLAQLSGWPARTPPEPEGRVDTPRDPPDFERLLGVARERLPSLKVHAARVSEAKARVELAEREAWTKPSIGARYIHEGNPGAEGAYDVLMGMLAVPVPSFQRNQAGRAETRAAATVAEAELAAERALLEARVAKARSEVVAAKERTLAYGTEILPRFEENLTLLQRSFELGEIDLLALTTGRERLLRVQSDAFGAQLDYFVALAGLERVVGVDLWRDEHDEETAP